MSESSRLEERINNRRRRRWQRRLRIAAPFAALPLLLALAVHAEVGVRCAELGVGRARPRVRGAEC